MSAIKDNELLPEVLTSGDIKLLGKLTNEIELLPDNVTIQILLSTLLYELRKAERCRESAFSLIESIYNYDKKRISMEVGGEVSRVYFDTLHSTSEIMSFEDTIKKLSHPDNILRGSDFYMWLLAYSLFNDGENGLPTDKSTICSEFRSNMAANACEHLVGLRSETGTEREKPNILRSENIFVMLVIAVVSFVITTAVAGYSQAIALMLGMITTFIMLLFVVKIISGRPKSIGNVTLHLGDRPSSVRLINGAARSSMYLARHNGASFVNCIFNSINVRGHKKFILSIANMLETLGVNTKVLPAITSDFNNYLDFDAMCAYYDKAASLVEAAKAEKILEDHYKLEGDLMDNDYESGEEEKVGVSFLTRNHGENLKVKNCLSDLVVEMAKEVYSPEKVSTCDKISTEELDASDFEECEDIGEVKASTVKLINKLKAQSPEGAELMKATLLREYVK